MRIRSVLAATVLGIALAAAGATTATADEGAGHHHSDEGRGYHQSEEGRGYKESDEGSGHRHYFDEDKGNCSPYIGAVKTSSADIFWAGEHCHLI
ncbi:hypothetical protein [Streptomyces sp. ME18-1-4]|uniref:hypothetical protein n=1 Tax=Streptomyces sp. ME18-1-4 TaxID=3028685 RepID=UPI0029A3B3EB|nr:hypothetical protein [Streptomyces sp. ME18-1-4]MDX3243452.1 hypothetical protein [Streptomyces sp. ME18-1-4]